MTGPAGPVGALLSYGAYLARGRQPPPQRAVAGFDLPFGTPVANLWNVGDGVKEYANGGTTACAETAKLVPGQITARFPLTAEPEVGDEDRGTVLR